MRTGLATLLAVTALAMAALLGPVALVAAATDPGCTLLNGDDTTTPGVCEVSAAVNVGGVINVGEPLHLLAGGVLNVTAASLTLTVDPGSLEMDGGSSIVGPGKDITILVPNGDMTMHSGSSISTTVTTNGGAAGDITIHVGNFPNTPPKGVFVMEIRSTVEANGGPSGAGGDIEITAGHHSTIDGSVLSQVNSGQSGGTGRDGGAIFVKTGCGLTVGQSGKLSSIGQDQGADLVHLESCDVTISGLVESTGAGHGIPQAPNQNHCDNGFRPGKPSNSTACVEVWADNITITSTGEINADLNASGVGGSGGESWVDLFANTNISVTGPTGGGSRFAVHADTNSGSDNTPNTITAKAVNGSLTASGRAFSATGTGNGSGGGTIVLQAKNTVDLNASVVTALGDDVGISPPCGSGSGTCGNGGHISIRSFNANIIWNGEGDVRPNLSGPNGAIGTTTAGTLDLTACTSVNTTGANFHGFTPTVNAAAWTGGPPAGPAQCGGNPPLPAGYTVDFRIAIWAACRQGPGPGTKSGEKFNDVDNSGTHNAGDTPLANWTINLLSTGNALLDTTTTAGNGTYSFVIPTAGTYRACEGAGPAGYVQTFPNAGTPNPSATDVVINTCPGPNVWGYQFTIALGQSVTGDDFGNFKKPIKAGLKFNDIDNSGTRNAGDTLLAGQQINLLTTGNAIVQSTTTAANGTYSFTINAPGTYKVCENPSLAGFTQTYPNAGTANPNPPNDIVINTCPAPNIWGYQIIVASGSELRGDDFGNHTQLPPAKKSGQKFQDVDKSGTHNAGDTPLQNWTIQLRQGVNVIQTATTDVNGNYNFTISTFGTYQVCEVAPAGWTQTYPNAGTANPNPPNDIVINTCPAPNIWGYQIIVASGDNFTGDDFGNFKPPVKSGLKFNDVDNSGTQNAGDTPLAGQQINLLTTGNANVQTATTAADGSYSFTIATPGTYKVCEGPSLGGFTQTYPNAGTANPNAPNDIVINTCPAPNIWGYQIVVASSSEFRGDNFGNHTQTPPATKSGMKFNDTDNSGTHNAGDTPLQSWTIQLRQGVNVIQTATTDVNGNYGFTITTFGTYQVCEVGQAGTTQTYPNAGTANPNAPNDIVINTCPGPAIWGYQITVASGDNFTGDDFGNFKPAPPNAHKQGLKFNDLNGNGVRDGSPLEPGVSGWEIKIWNATQTVVIGTTTTNASGVYDFFVPAGSYVVCETLQAGWMQTSPVAGAGIVTCGSGGLGYAITLTSGQEDINNDFGNRQPPVEACPPGTIQQSATTGNRVLTAARLPQLVCETPTPTPTSTVAGVTSPPKPHVTLPPTDGSRPLDQSGTGTNLPLIVALLIGLAALGPILVRASRKRLR